MKKIILLLLMAGSIFFATGCEEAIRELRGLLGDLEQMANETEENEEATSGTDPNEQTDDEATEEETDQEETDNETAEEGTDEEEAGQGEQGGNNSTARPDHYIFVTDRGKSGNISTQGGLHDLTDDWVYFANQDHQNFLYKIKIDGSGLTQLTDHPVRNINVLGNWVYYLELNSTNYINIKSFNKISTDGSAIEIIIPDDSVTQVHTYKNDIYFIHNYQITRMTQSGEQTGLPYLASDMSISEDLIVYYGYDEVNDLEGYFLGDINGTPAEMIRPEGYGYYTLVGNYLFYTRGDGHEGLFKLDVFEGDPVLITDDFVDYFNVDRSYVYYSTAESEATREMMRMDHNGNNNVPMSYVTNSINIFDTHVMGEFMRQGYYSFYFTNKRTGEITEIEIR